MLGRSHPRPTRKGEVHHPTFAFPIPRKPGASACIRASGCSQGSRSIPGDRAKYELGCGVLRNFGSSADADLLERMVEVLTHLGDARAR